ncbi:MAG: peptide ABC transporter substrate-binding protein, partial [Candidatus Brocadiales bacterium]|nr:peptide ABC transporter substrate-binding protein [Candidatus Brocadiales bacterium]
KVLNPILNADSASSSIVDQVFNGLIDRDEDLRFRGRLAESWEIFEEAFFYLNPKATINGKRITDPELIKKKLLAYKSNSSFLEKTLKNIKGIEIIPPTQGETIVQAPGPDTNNDGFPDPLNVKVKFKAPYRFKVMLKKVDQDFFENLTSVLGKNYFNSFPAADYI